MAVPLTAEARIAAHYTVSGEPHVLHVYVRNATPVGSTYNINTRATDSNDLDWEDAAEALQETMTYLFGDPDSVHSPAALELYDSGAWVPTQYHTFGGTDHATTTPVLGIGLVVTYRVSGLVRMKIMFAEPNVGGPIKVTSYAGTGRLEMFIKQFTADGTVTNNPYDWVVNRGNQYLIAGGTFVSATSNGNRKLRRMRGLA